MHVLLHTISSYYTMSCYYYATALYHITVLDRVTMLQRYNAHIGVVSVVATAVTAWCY
jgi:hypothetical protein